MLEDLFKESTTNIDILLEVLEEGNHGNIVIIVMTIILIVPLAVCVIIFLITRLTSELIYHLHCCHAHQVHCL